MNRIVTNPSRARLIRAVLDHIAQRSGCMIASDMGNALLVFRRRKFTAVETVNAEGFMPYTSQKEIQVPVPILLIFDQRSTDKRLLARFHALGGDSVLVKTLADATEALDRG